jgi:hypothetical protein
MLLKSIAVLTLVLTLSPVARSGDAKDGDTIEGTWLPSAAELGGADVPRRNPQDHQARGPG